MELETFKLKILPLKAKLLNTSRMIVKEEADAEDIVQEVFLKLWHIRDRLDAYLNVEAVAVTAARNLALDRLRAQKAERNGEACRTACAKDGNPEELLERKDALSCVRLLISRLPPLQQTIIRMKDVEGYEVEEIAGITGCTAEAVRVNLSRARKKIKEQFTALNNRYEYR
jgi:RNA polymerase sigma-70 factor (ECF subfamily)